MSSPVLDTPYRSRAVRRHVHRYPGETGVVVLGRFKPLLAWISVDGWSLVGVRLDGSRTNAVELHEAKPGPHWIPVAPGRHELDFVGNATHPHRCLTVDVRAGRVKAVAFKAPIWRPFLPPTAESWHVFDAR